jgi:hypothetical protein
MYKILANNWVVFDITTLSIAKINQFSNKLAMSKLWYRIKRVNGRYTEVLCKYSEVHNKLDRISTYLTD